MLIEITYNVTDVYMSTTETPVYVEISFEQPGGTSAVWGSITGTLSNQTDLQNALNAKFDDPTGTTAQYIRGDGTLATFPALTDYVPYSGATGNVNLGEYELKAGQLTLDTTPTGTAAVGTTRWNDTIGSSETTLKGGSVILKNGVDLVARVVNKVTPNTTLTKAAYQAVRVSGAQGQRLAVALAQANNDANSADTIGLVTETIPTNQEGFIITVGQLENINTTGSLQGETWVDGDVLYLSPTTAGALTNIKPTGSGHIVVIGYVEYAHANNGKIYTKVMNGWELDELHDVDIISPANNEALIYESSSALWKNKTIATALGYTPANAATTLTINGVTYDLSTSRTWTISTGISGSGASGQVTYWTGASAVSGSNNLFWDNTNGRLGIGTNAPAYPLHITRSSGSYVAPLWVENTGSASIDFKNVAVFVGARGNASNIDDNTNIGIWQKSNIVGNYGVVNFYNSSGNLTAFLGAEYSVHTTNQTGNLIFGTVNAGTVAVKAKLYNTGNLVLQNGGTFSDSGQRLQVIGDTLLRGSGATSATTALTVQNSSSVQSLAINNAGQAMFGTNAQSAGVKLETDGVFRAWTRLEVGQFGNAQYTVSGYNRSVSGSDFFSFDNNTSYSAIAGTYYFLRLNTNIAPTSGNAVVNQFLIQGTINQTGGANGITRGLYVNPTLTAAADFRAIETTAGNVLFGSNFFWDNANGRLGIGTNVPLRTLNVNGRSLFGSATNPQPLGSTHTVDIVASTTDSPLALIAGSGNLELWKDTTPTRAVAIGMATPGNAISNDLYFSLFNGTSWNTRFVITNSTGNISIGTTSDLGVRLGVVGDTLLRGSGATSATTALTVQNSSSTNLFTIDNSGFIEANTSTSSIFVRNGIVFGATSAAARIGPSASNAINVRFTQGSTNLLGAYGAGIQNSAYLFSYPASNNTDANTNSLWGIVHTFNPTSASSGYIMMGLQPTINQTGGANGITRGLYVNPTLTSAADFRAIETARGNIVFGNLPTSSAGLPTGALWNDAGTVKIV